MNHSWLISQPSIHRISSRHDIPFLLDVYRLAGSIDQGQSLQPARSPLTVDRQLTQSNILGTKNRLAGTIDIHLLALPLQCYRCGQCLFLDACTFSHCDTALKSGQQHLYIPPLSATMKVRPILEAVHRPTQ